MIENYQDYVVYLNKWIIQRPKKGHGFRSKIAEFLGVQTSYISQILSEKVVISEEHGFRLNDLLNHDSLESDYFLSMIAEKRAGSSGLKGHYKKKCSEIRLKLKEAVREDGSDTQFLDDFSKFEKYYSSWHYSAAHIFSSIQQISSKSLSEKFGISEATATQIIEYLYAQDLLTKEGQKYSCAGSSFHLPKGHPLIFKHHVNWKIKAIESLQNQKHEPLHFSSVTACSKADAEVIMDDMRDFIRDIRKRIASSPEEELFCYSLDFFSPFI